MSCWDGPTQALCLSARGQPLGKGTGDRSPAKSEACLVFDSTPPGDFAVRCSHQRAPRRRHSRSTLLPFGASSPGDHVSLRDGCTFSLCGRLCGRLVNQKAIALLPRLHSGGHPPWHRAATSPGFAPIFGLRYLGATFLPFSLLLRGGRRPSFPSLPNRHRQER